jgi:riboflavin kinase / FMN adenylyltransferase
MKAVIFRSLNEAKLRFEASALAIGNFDGVHVGHQALLARTLTVAAPKNLVPSVLTFHPHPTSVVAPDRTPKLITNLEEKLRLLDSLGVGQIMVLPFTHEIAGTNPREFVSQILVESLKVGVVLVGQNFRFGHKQAGTPATLRSLGQEFGFESQFLEPVIVRGEIASSSAVRKHVSEGSVARAARLLNRCFFVEAPVVSGHGIGSRQTVPTLNLRPDPDQVLPRGVFVTETWELPSGRRWPSITNVGNRPTFQGEEVTIETYLLEPLAGPAPERIQVHFRRFLRAERPFPDAASLKTQILRDVGRAQTYWRRAANLSRLTPSIY